MSRVHGVVPSVGFACVGGGVGGAIYSRGCAGVHPRCGSASFGAGWVVVSRAEGARLCAFGMGWPVPDWCCVGHLLSGVHCCVLWAWIRCCWGWSGGGKSYRGYMAVRLEWRLACVVRRYAGVFAPEGVLVYTLGRVGCRWDGAGGAICRQGCAGVHPRCGSASFGAGWVVISHAEGARSRTLGGDGAEESAVPWIASGKGAAVHWES